MKFLEKDLEQIIFESNLSHLWGRGLYLQGRKLRQVRIGNYGIADLVILKRPAGDDFEKHRGIITVCELKQNKIGVSAFLQALGYLKGIDNYLGKRGFCLDNFDYEICLIGSEMESNSSFSYLTDFLIHEVSDKAYFPRLHLSCYTYSYDFDGISFSREDGYKLIDEGF